MQVDPVSGHCHVVVGPGTMTKIWKATCMHPIFPFARLAFSGFTVAAQAKVPCRTSPVVPLRSQGSEGRLEHVVLYYFGELAGSIHLIVAIYWLSAGASANLFSY